MNPFTDTFDLTFATIERVLARVSSFVQTENENILYVTILINKFRMSPDFRKSFGSSFGNFSKYICSNIIIHSRSGVQDGWRILSPR
jgi:hypothetical protein